MYSIQQRLEIYLILYTWKAVTRKVHNCGFLENNKGDFKLALPPMAKATGKIRSLKEESLKVTGVKLFNSLPLSLRTIRSENIEVFKRALDCMLSILPDERLVRNLTPLVYNQISGRPSNRLLDLIREHTNKVKAFNTKLTAEMNSFQSQIMTDRQISV